MPTTQYLEGLPLAWAYRENGIQFVRVIRDELRKWEIVSFSERYATKIAYLGIAGIVGIGLCSIWYGAWYPDAQSLLHAELLAKDTDATKPTFWVVGFHYLNWYSPPLYTILSLFLGVVGGGSGVIAGRRLEGLLAMESKFFEEEEAHAETQKYYYRSLKDHLIELFGRQVPGFNPKCRASVYRFDKAANVFRLVFRYSLTTKYEKRGRTTLPGDEGVLAATHLNAECVFIEDLPEFDAKRSRYLRATNDKLKPYGVTLSEKSKGAMRMPSRCYLGYAIRDFNSTDKFAILILECTDPKCFDKDVVLAVFQSKSVKILEYVRYIAHLDSKLNPFGGLNEY